MIKKWNMLLILLAWVYINGDCMEGPFININVSGNECVQGELTYAGMYNPPIDITKTLTIIVAQSSSECFQQ